MSLVSFFSEILNVNFEILFRDGYFFQSGSETPERSLVGSTYLGEAIKFLLGAFVPCDDYGPVVTSVLILGGVERRSTNTKPMATPNKTINTHTHHCGCLLLAL